MAAVLHDAGDDVAGPAIDVDESRALTERCPPDGAILDLDLAGRRNDPVAVRLIARGVRFADLTGQTARAVHARHRAVPMIARPVVECTLRAARARLIRDRPLS